MAHYILSECLGNQTYREVSRFEGGQHEIGEEIAKAKRHAPRSRYVVREIEAPTTAAPIDDEQTTLTKATTKRRRKD